MTLEDRTGVDLEGNPYLPTAGEVIDSPWGQAVVNRIIPRYSTEAVRDASILDPDAGQLSYVTDADRVDIFDGSDWTSFVDGVFLPLTGGTISGSLAVTGNVDVTGTVDVASDVDVAGDLAVTGGELAVGDTSDSFQRVSWNRNGRIGRIETTGDGFNFFTMLTNGAFPIRFNPNGITVLRLDGDLAEFFQDVRFPAGSNLDPTVRFAGMTAGEDGIYGDGDEVSVAFGNYRNLSVLNNPGAGHSHVEARGDSAVPLNVERDQDGLDDSAIMIRFLRQGQPEIDLTWGDLEKIKALP